MSLGCTRRLQTRRRHTHLKRSLSFPHLFARQTDAFIIVLWSGFWAAETGHAMVEACGGDGGGAWGSVFIDVDGDGGRGVVGDGVVGDSDGGGGVGGKVREDRVSDGVGGDILLVLVIVVFGWYI
ncbi:hypothetical protein Pmani_020586 [Petrolisthes manimaculis]|uniref:Uncharacterized protein n=1 Tax=Petrolisthes manimaculis TaxID=1843537 RepID=A0AAE1PHD3_9EUCA|nr:hypothetical protein Pmani_020586 [Petrolisthes manimaculis]